MSREQESTQPNEAQIERPFCRAARFNGEDDSRQAYQAAEVGIAGLQVNMSVYRLQLRRRWHVAAVAEEAPELSLQRIVEESLSGGVGAELTPEVLTVLLSRHREMMKHRLPWIEGHYHPGRRVELDG